MSRCVRWPKREMPHSGATSARHRHDVGAPADLHWSDVGPTSARRRTAGKCPTSARHRHDVGALADRLWSDVGPTSALHRPDADVTSARHLREVGATSARQLPKSARHRTVLERPQTMYRLMYGCRGGTGFIPKSLAIPHEGGARGR